MLGCGSQLNAVLVELGAELDFVTELSLLYGVLNQGTLAPTASGEQPLCILMLYPKEDLLPAVVGLEDEVREEMCCNLLVWASLTGS